MRCNRSSKSIWRNISIRYIHMHKKFAVRWPSHPFFPLPRRRGDCKEEISKLLGDPARVFTTKCVMHELRKMGGEFTAARHAAKRYALHQCGHDTAVSAAECLAAQVEAGNTEHFFLATQDRGLQRKVSAQPGGAVIFASVNGLHLEAPSDAQRKHVQAGETVGAAGLPGMRPGAGSDSDEEGGRHQTRDRPVFRRNKAKGPNPLSIRKKAKRPAEGGGGGGGGSGGEGEQQKRKRQRRKRAEDGGDGGGGGDE